VPWKNCLLDAVCFVLCVLLLFRTPSDFPLLPLHIVTEHFSAYPRYYSTLEIYYPNATDCQACAERRGTACTIYTVPHTRINVHWSYLSDYPLYQHSSYNSKKVGLFVVWQYYPFWLHGVVGADPRPDIDYLQKLLLIKVHTDYASWSTDNLLVVMPEWLKMRGGAGWCSETEYLMPISEI
jgi:hypothetical protein